VRVLILELHQDMLRKRALDVDAVPAVVAELRI